MRERTLGKSGVFESLGQFANAKSAFVTFSRPETETRPAHFSKALVMLTTSAEPMKVTSLLPAPLSVTPPELSYSLTTEEKRKFVDFFSTRADFCEALDPLQPAHVQAGDIVVPDVGRDDSESLESFL